MAGLEHFKVISVDYRMPPEAYFPAAIDDVLTVYKALQRTTDPKNMAIFRHLGRRSADVGSDSAG